MSKRKQSPELLALLAKITRGRAKIVVDHIMTAVCSFGDPSLIRSDRVGGRRAFSKAFKAALVERFGSKCAICSTPYGARYLQIDHRVPCQIAGDSPAADRNLEDYMLLCGSCQRAKSWSCEHCGNWREARQPEICKTCYWATPEDYNHIALQDHRRLEIVWLGESEVAEHTGLKHLAQQNRIELPIYAKAALAEHVRRVRERPGEAN